MSGGKLEWDPEAERRLRKAPYLIRNIARKRVERAARKQGVTRVTVELLEQVKRREMGSD